MAAGCGPAEVQPADPASAHAALETALTAWKAGQAPDSLAAGSPPIVVADHRWRGGYKLDSYEIQGDGRNQGADLRVKVTLKQLDPQGKPLVESPEYAVGTGSPHTVVRDDNE
jgi:hypothetical protein